MSNYDFMGTKVPDGFGRWPAAVARASGGAARLPAPRPSRRRVRVGAARFEDKAEGQAQIMRSWPRARGADAAAG